jgi:plastocyanin
MLSAALVLAATLLGAAGCKLESGGDVTPDSTAPPNVAAGEVLVKSVAFTPSEVRTTVGKPVTWKFDDGGLEHTVTADDNSFDSGRMSSGAYPRTFSAAGTINYHCQVHSRMHGTIVVSG